MTQTESTASDLPFPGAHSQVPGQRHESAPPLLQDAKSSPRRLPLGSAGAPWERGWRIRLAVRAEHVEVDKRVVGYERLRIARRQTDDVARVTATVRREELRVDRTGSESAVADAEPRNH